MRYLCTLSFSTREGFEKATHLHCRALLGNPKTERRNDLWGMKLADGTFQYSTGSADLSDAPIMVFPIEVRDVETPITTADIPGLRDVSFEPLNKATAASQ